MIAQEDAELMLEALKAIDKFCAAIGPKPSKEILSIQLRCRIVIDQVEKAPHRT